MDSAACRALHVGGYGDDDAAKAGMTVTAVIDKCRTAQVSMLTEFVPLKW